MMGDTHLVTESGGAPPGAGIVEEDVLGSLAAYVRECWNAARRAKGPVEARMVRSLRQRNGEYDPEKLAEIRRQNGSETYMMLTAVKCRAAESWIRDVLSPAGDQPWSLDPTPIPELSPEVERVLAEQIWAEAGWQAAPEELLSRYGALADDLRAAMIAEARLAAERMSRRITDQMVEGGFRRAFEEAIWDIITYPAGVLKGPVLRRRPSLKWARLPDGSFQPVAGEALLMEFDRVSPFNIYPAPGATGVEDGFVIERHRLTRRDLSALIGVPGYDEAAIRRVLEAQGRGEGSSWLVIDAGLPADVPRDQYGPDGAIDALEFWGSVQGRALIEWGMDEDDVSDPEAEYPVNAWLIDREIIRAVVNPDPMGRKPYSKASFENIPGSFWGRGVPELMRDVQLICNATARALVNNMAIASGPQVEVSVDRVPPGEDVTEVFPWKIWQTSSDGSGAPAVRFHQPDPIAGVLMQIYSEFSRLADDYTGIPAYAYGSPVASGAGRTAAGLSMLMNAASKGIKQVIANIDAGVIEPTVLRLYHHNMLYDPDASIKGDCRVTARGSAALIAKEQMQLRRTEFLRATANPLDAKIIGVEGRAAILREAVKALDMPVSEVVPNREELSRRLRMEAGEGEGGEC